MTAGRRTWRRVLLLGVPSLYVVLGILHPTANPELGDETDLFVRLHIAQLFLIVGLAWVLWLLVEGVTNRAATLARALIVLALLLCLAPALWRLTNAGIAAPVAAPKAAEVKELEIPVQVNGKLRSRVIAAPDVSEDDLRAAALADDRVRSLIDGHEVVKVIVVPQRLVNIVIKST